MAALEKKIVGQLVIGSDYVATASAVENYVQSVSGELKTTLNNTNLSKSDFSQLSAKIGLSAATDTNPVVTKNDIADLAGAMHFIGAVVPTEGQPDINAISEHYMSKSLTPKAGDIVIITTNSKEYVYSGSTWIELGDEILYATKSEVAVVSNNITSNYATTITLNTVSGSLSTDYQGKINGLTSNVKHLSNEITSITSAYATQQYVNTNFYTKSETSSKTEIQTALSEKQPTGNYLTAHQSLTGYYQKSETSSAAQLTTAENAMKTYFHDLLFDTVLTKYEYTQEEINA